MYSSVQVVNVKNDFSQKNASSPLHDGSVVKTRVISKEKSGFYAVSFAGHKFRVQSQKTLLPGQVFKAQIFVKDGKVFLKEVLESAKNSGLETFNLKNFDSSSPGLKNMLIKLGLPVIPESLRLIQFALEMGIKIEPSKLKNSLLRGQKSEKKGIQKSQVALLLEEKGLSPTDFAVEAVTRNFYDEENSGKKDRDNDGNSFFEKKSGDKSNEKSSEKSDKESDEGKINSDDIKEYFESVFESARKNKCGPLSLFNSLKPKNSTESHWIVLPFEWSFDGYFGVIRVLLSADKKCIKKLLINCKNSQKSYSFVLYLSENKVKAIKFALKNASDSVLRFLNQKLKTFFPLSSVESADFEELEGFAAENTELGIFDGEA
mgnify:FL=1